MKNHLKPLCPSASYDQPGSVVFGVVGGTAEKPELVPLARPRPVTDEVLEMAAPVSPSEVFRFAVPCACSGCGHFNAENQKCRLAEKTVRWAPVVADKLPACGIRSSCKWWQQEGRAACERCPQVVTLAVSRPNEVRKIVDPSVV